MKKNNLKGCLCFLFFEKQHISKEKEEKFPKKEKKSLTLPFIFRPPKLLEAVKGSPFSVKQKNRSHHHSLAKGKLATSLFSKRNRINSSNLSVSLCFFQNKNKWNPNVWFQLSLRYFVWNETLKRFLDHRLASCVSNPIQLVGHFMWCGPMWTWANPTKFVLVQAFRACSLSPTVALKILFWPNWIFVFYKPKWLFWPKPNFIMCSTQCLTNT